MATTFLEPGGVSLELSKEFASFLPVLIKIISITSEAVMELGTGFYSTTFLHWACFPKKRDLISYENSMDYFKIFQVYQDDFHKVLFADNFKEVVVDRHYDVIFIDHFPQEDRKVQLEKLVKDANYIIVHDTMPDDFVGISKYRFDYTKVVPNTSVFSNFIDISNLEI